MRKEGLEIIIETIAREYGVSPEEVRRDIQEAIDAGMNSSDPAVREFRKRIPHKGIKPTIEEVLDYAVRQIRTSAEA